MTHDTIDATAYIYELLDLGETEEIEFKSAKGGFPKDVWETYSAFANTQGGIIVLGVQEKKGLLSLSGLSEAEVKKLKDTFWRSVHNSQVISVCLQSNDDVQIVEVNACFVLTIYVRQATRAQKPVYCNLIADKGTYRRNDTGDFLCSAAEVRRMMADADPDRPADSRILKGFSWDDIDMASFEQYRRVFTSLRPEHPWVTEDNEGLMRKLGGYRKDRASGEEGFTLAGLLMFGKSEAIRDPECAPHFFPDYKEIEDEDERWSNRIYADGSWEANLFQFYRRVLPRLQSVLPTPFRLEDGQRQDVTPAHEALREAFANLCIHADYSEESSLLVTKYTDKIVFSNPGTMLISRDQFFDGGESACRNKSLQQMFMLMGVAEKAGSGVAKILKGWSASQWQAPCLEERFRPNKVVLELPLVTLLDDSVLSELKVRLGAYFDTLDEHECRLLATALTEKTINNDRLTKLIPLHKADITTKLQKLCKDGALIAEGYGRGRVYHIKGWDERLQANDASSGERLQASGVSSDEKGQVSGVSSDEKGQVGGVSSDEKGQAIPARLSAVTLDRLIDSYCIEWRTIQQIAEYLGKTKKHIRKVLPRFIEGGKLEQKYPDIKNHPNQQYRTKQKKEA